MPVKALIIPLEPGKYYHVYNRGNNKEKLFYNAGDYYIFLRRYRQYLEPYLKTYAYCLLPNHFHFLVRIDENPGKSESTVSNQFRKLFICHARRINSLHERKGCLLTRNFRRVEISEARYLLNLVRYIHYNPVKHGYNTTLSQYPYSSFHDFITNKGLLINRTEVLQWFGGWEQFLEYHWSIEEDKLFLGMLSDD